MEKLEGLIKKAWSFVFKYDPKGLDKFAFIFEWALFKSEDYHPKCLFFTSRLAILYIISSIEEEIGMNAKIDQVMTNNF